MPELRVTAPAVRETVPVDLETDEDTVLLADVLPLPALLLMDVSLDVPFLEMPDEAFLETAEDLDIPDVVLRETADDREP